MPKQQHKVFILFYIIMLLMASQAAIDIYLPSLPAMQQYFKVSADVIQLTMPFLFLGVGFPQLFFGILSDRFGRRPIILLGYSIFIIGGLICILTHSIGMLLFGRFLQGLGGASSSAMFRAIIRDRFEGSELIKTLSYIAILWALLPILMPVLGGYVQITFGWKMNFILLIAFAVLALYLTFFHLKETHKAEHRQTLSPKTIIKSIKLLISNPCFMGYTAIAVMLLGMLFGFMTTATILLQNRLGLTPVEYGWCIFIIASAYMIGGFINTRIAHLYESITLLLISLSGLFIFCAAFLASALMFGLHTAAILLPTFAIFFFLGIAYPRCTAGAISLFPQVAGLSGATFGTFTFAGLTIITFIISHLPAHSQLPLSYTFLTLSIAAFIIFIRFILPTKGKRGAVAN